MKNCISKRYFVYPYLFSLSVIGLVFLAVGYCITVYCIFAPPLNKSVWGVFVEYLPVFIFLLAVLILYFCAYSKEMYLYFGTYKLSSDAIHLYAPFRRTIIIPYDEVRCSGIGYDVINGSYQFWIYLSKCPIAKCYWGDFSKLPITHSTVRVQYSKKAFQGFMNVAPESIRNDLQKGVQQFEI